MYVKHKQRLKMKNLILSLLFITSISIAQAQRIENKDIPKSIVATFSKMYPQVKTSDVKWKLDKGNYKAEFSNGKEYEVLIDKYGNWLATEIEITDNDLPQSIKDSIYAGEFKDWKVTQIEQVENNQSKILYELNVVKDGKEYEITYDPNGNLINKEEE